MGLTDDPFYRKMVEGYDTRLIVGTMKIVTPSPSGDRSETFPLFMIDYYSAPMDMEPLVADTLDKVDKINLHTKDGTYTVDVDEQGTMVMFSEGETAAHTAPNFWGQYTPQKEEHEAFQKELSRLGVWLFYVATKDTLREFVVDTEGRIVYKRKTPLTDHLRKMLGLGT